MNIEFLDALKIVIEGVAVMPNDLMRKNFREVSSAL